MTLPLTPEQLWEYDAPPAPESKTQQLGEVP